MIGVEFIFRILFIFFFLVSQSPYSFCPKTKKQESYNCLVFVFSTSLPKLTFKFDLFPFCVASIKIQSHPGQDQTKHFGSIGDLKFKEINLFVFVHIL